MNKKLPMMLAFSAAFCILLISCKHEIPYLVNSNTTDTDGSQECNPDSVYFKNSIQPLLNSSCAMSGCHDAASHKEGVILTTYTEIVNTGKLVPYNAPISRLYKCLNASGEDRMPRSPAMPFTQAQKDLVYKWIMQGALNNACSACDTTVYTYSGAIAPMMGTYCAGCHNPSLTGGGYDLTTYDGVKQAVIDDRLRGSIEHADGYSPMPQGTDQMSDCKLTQVRRWIEAGAPNN